MYELDDKSKKIIFSHNPFSMPQGNLKDLNFDKPLEIKTINMILFAMELNFHQVRLEIIFLN